MLHKQGFLTSGRALQWTRVDGDNDDDDVWDLERRDGTATMIARNTEYSHFALELANISQTPQSLANALSSSPSYVKLTPLMSLPRHWPRFSRSRVTSHTCV